MLSAPTSNRLATQAASLLTQAQQQAQLQGKSTGHVLSTAQKQSMNFPLCNHQLRLGHSSSIGPELPITSPPQPPLGAGGTLVRSIHSQAPALWQNKVPPCRTTKCRSVLLLSCPRSAKTSDNALCRSCVFGGHFSMAKFHSKIAQKSLIWHVFFFEDWRDRRVLTTFRTAMRSLV